MAFPHPLQPLFFYFSLRLAASLKQFFFFNDSVFSVLSGQRAADAAQPAQTLRSGPHRSGQEGADPSETHWPRLPVELVL